MTNGPRLGISTAAFFPRSLEETYQILKRQVWQHVELMPQAPAECRPEFADRLHALGADQLRVTAIHFPQILQPFLFNPYAAAFEFAQRVCMNLGNLAGALGCSVVVVHGPWATMSTGPFLRATLANLRLLCDTCFKHEVTVALENTTSSPFADSPEAMLAFASTVKRPNLSFALDTTHAHQLNQDPMIYIEGLPKLAHIHASDFAVEGGQRHLPPGDGVINWPALIGALRDKGFDGNFIIELLPETLGDDPALTLQRSIGLLSPHFEDWSRPAASRANGQLGQE